MKSSSEKLRIGDVAKKLNVERFVIRFWEREFGIKARRSSGGQRFYDAKDVQRIILIKELLYDNGLTIAGAKKYLEQHKTTSSAKKMHMKAAQLDTSSDQKNTVAPTPAADTTILVTHLQEIRQNLLKIKSLLH